MAGNGHAGVAVGEGDGVEGDGFSIAFTWLRCRRVTIPWRRYQIPSPVSHTSSASTEVPLVSRIVNCPRVALSSPPVDKGLELSVTGAGSAGGGVVLGEGDGSGDGDGLTEIEGGKDIRGAGGCTTA